MADFFNHLLIFVVLWGVMHVPCVVIAILVSGCGPSDGWTRGYNGRLAVAAFGLALFANLQIEHLQTARAAAERCLY